MKHIIVLLSVVCVIGCSTVTPVTIMTNVPDAEVYVDDQYQGLTEGTAENASLTVRMRNKGTTVIRLVKEGYKQAVAIALTEIKAINVVGGVMMLVPFIWIVGPMAIQRVVMQEE